MQTDETPKMPDFDRVDTRLLSFATWAWNNSVVTTGEDILYLLEKPWKWASEYADYLEDETR